MGVGISYKGRGGKRRFDLNGVPTGEADALFKTPRRHKQLLPENFKKALHPLPVDPIAKENEGKVKLNAFDMRPDTLDKKTMPGSAVRTSMSGLCLEGEQENPSVVGTKLYGSHGGKKGYHGFDEFDPPVEGGRVGVLGAGGEGADISVAKAGAPFAYQVTSRVVMETDDLGRQILVEYDKDVQNTALGRSHTVTGERRRVVGIVDPRGDGVEFLHPYEVKWAKDLDEGKGGWIIWLPSQYLLFVDGVPRQIVGKEEKELEAAGGAYPRGWYRLGELLSSESNGQLWLRVKMGGGVLCSEKGEEEGHLYFLVCETTVNKEKGLYSVKNSITSAVVVRVSDMNTDTDYVPDGRSLSNEHSDTDGALNCWQIKGFGKYKLPGVMNTLGTFLQSTDSELSEDEATDYSVLVRTGDTDGVGTNSIGYRRLKLKKGEGYLTPFQYKETKGGNNIVRSIVNNIFYFDGEEITIDDFTNVPLDGFVFLCGTREKNDEDSGMPSPWTFTIEANQTAVAPEGGKAINIRLYEFKGGKIKCDYRTTFLTLGSGDGEDKTPTKIHFSSTQLAEKLEPDKEPTVYLTGDGTEKSPLQFSFGIPQGNGIKEISHEPNSEPGGYSIVTIKLDDGREIPFYVYNGMNGVVDESRLYQFQVNGDIIGKVIDGPGGNLIQKKLVAGEGIYISEEGNVLTISVVSTTGGFTGTRYVLRDVRYEFPNLQKKFITETWEDGVLTDSVEGEWETYHTAVEETI